MTVNCSLANGPLVQNQKEPCHVGQDSFTRTLYENEKITFRINYMVNVPPMFPQMKLLL